MIEKPKGQPVVQGLALERHKFLTIINEQHLQINTLRSNIRQVERRCENQQRKLEKLLLHLSYEGKHKIEGSNLKKEQQSPPPRDKFLMTQSMLVRSPTDYKQLPLIKVSVEKLRPLDGNEVRRRKQQMGYD